MDKPVQQPSSRPMSAGTRGVVASAALLLPSLTLVPLGGLYLWEHGLLLWWALFALICVGVLTGALKWILRTPVRSAAAQLKAGDQPAEAHWTAAEQLAWRDVQQVAFNVELENLTSLDSFVTLGQQTLDVVARRIHPEHSDALWQFTLPEALAIVERVSRRLGGFVVDTVPFGDRLTVAQMLAAYRWRGMFGAAERAYDVWRIVRLVNPATAVTNEARERLTRAVFNYGKEHVSRRIAEAFVEEVGRAAIDLYGGRLKVAQRLSAQDASDDPLRELASRPVALNIAIAGGTRSDRLALGSLLADAAHSAKLSAATAPAASETTLSEPRPAQASSGEPGELTAELQDADVVIWIVTGDEDDLTALSALAAHIRARGDAAIPALVPVAIMTSASADGRRDPHGRSQLRAQASGIAQALDTIATDLIEVPPLDFAQADALNTVVEAVRTKMVTGRRVHIQRALGAARRPSGWKQSARQALKAAGALTRAVVRRGHD